MTSAQSTKTIVTGKVHPVNKRLPHRDPVAETPLPASIRQLQDELQADRKLIRAFENRIEKLERDLINRELSVSAIYISQKNKILGLIRKELNRQFRIKNQLTRNEATGILETIDQSIHFENEWFRIKPQFERLHPGYFDRLRKKFPHLTPNDHKLCALLRMNLSTREMAQILKITAPSTEISRIRLRKKLDLRKNENLTQFICRI